MIDHAEHYEPTPRAARAIAAAWIAAGLCVLACRVIVSIVVVIARINLEWWTGTGTRWKTVAFVASASAVGWFGAGWHARGVGPVTVGAVSVAASAGELTGDSGELAPTADPLAALQDGYATPPADVRPVAPAERHAAPAGDPLPVWLPATVTRWEAYIRAGVAPYGIDPTLAAIVMTIESAGNRNAGSHVGARSLMQVMPTTAAGIDRERGRPHDPSMINDPTANIDYGAYNLAWCLRTYGVADDPDWRKSIGRACRCYNGGPSAVNDPVAESVAHDRWVVGMWSERHDATSPTFDEWREAGGQRALDIAATVDGPGEPGSGPALPHLEANNGR